MKEPSAAKVWCFTQETETSTRSHRRCGTVSALSTHVPARGPCAWTTRTAVPSRPAKTSINIPPRSQRAQSPTITALSPSHEKVSSVHQEREQVEGKGRLLSSLQLVKEAQELLNPSQTAAITEPVRKISVLCLCAL